MSWLLKRVLNDMSLRIIKLFQETHLCRNFVSSVDITHFLFTFLIFWSYQNLDNLWTLTKIYYVEMPEKYLTNFLMILSVNWPFKSLVVFNSLVWNLQIWSWNWTSLCWAFVSDSQCFSMFGTNKQYFYICYAWTGCHGRFTHKLDIKLGYRDIYSRLKQNKCKKFYVWPM